MDDAPQQTATTHPPELEMPGERLVRAILGHHLVSFRYQGRERIVEPHLLGLHEAGEPMLVAYQTAGASRSGDVPGWHTFITTSMENVEILDGTFAAPRSDMRTSAQPMLEIFARA